jgi:hypothetical protein
VAAFGNNIIIISPALTTGNWFHFAFVATSCTSIDFYLNGVLVGSNNIATVESLATGNKDWQIGTYIGGATWETNGRYDDLRAYNRALTVQEIGALVAGNQPATENTAASEITVEDTLNIDGNLTLNSGELNTKDAEDNEIDVAKAWDNNGGIFTANQSTVKLDGTSGSHELQSGGQNFYNLTLNQSGGTWTLNDRLEVDNTYTQSNGTVDTSTKDYNITAGDWDQTAGTFTTNYSNLTLNSSSSQTINTDDAVSTLQVEDPTENGLVGYWKMDEGQKTTTADSSGNSLTATLISGPTWVEQATQGLVGYWKLDETADNTCVGGEDACDSSKYSSDGTDSGGSSVSSTLPTVNFTNARSRDFDGTDDFLDMDDQAHLDVGDTADLTLSAWFNRGTSNTDDVLVAKRNSLGTATDAGYIAYIDATNDKVNFEISDGTDEYSLTSASTFTAAGWNHVTIVWDQDSAGNSEIYINGVDDNATDSGTIANIGDATNAVDFRLASESDGASYFDGNLDDVRVYSRGMSASEAKNMGLGNSTEGIANTTFDNPHSLDFDGTDDYVDMDDQATLDAGDNADLIISGWFNRDTSDTDDVLVAKRNSLSTASDAGYIAYLDATNDKINFEISDGTDEYSLTSATAFTSVGWNHFTIVWDQDNATNSEIYINGTGR